MSMRYKALSSAVALGVSLATAGWNFAAPGAAQPVAPQTVASPSAKSETVIVPTEVAPTGGTIGAITAAFGNATIQGPQGTRIGDLHAMLNNKERVVTDGGGVS